MNDNEVVRSCHAQKVDIALRSKLGIGLVNHKEGCWELLAKVNDALWWGNVSVGVVRVT